MFVNKQRTLASDSAKSLPRRDVYYKSRVDICVCASQQGRLPTAKPRTQHTQHPRSEFLRSCPNVASLLFLAEMSVPSRPRRTGQLIYKKYFRSNIPILIYSDGNRFNCGNRHTTGYTCTLRAYNPCSRTQGVP